GLRHADELMLLDQRLACAADSVEYEESRLLAELVRQIMSTGTWPATQLAYMPEKPDIGSCSRAEEYFLEIANGKIRRRGHINIVTDVRRRPLLVEKMHMGESHSAIVLEPLAIGGVLIPPGGLAALRHAGSAVAPVDGQRWQVLPLAAIAQARFLRLTTLAVSPANRERAFSSQFKRQIVLNMRGPDVTTTADLRAFVHARMAAS